MSYYAFVFIKNFVRSLDFCYHLFHIKRNKINFQCKKIYTHKPKSIRNQTLWCSKSTRAFYEKKNPFISECEYRRRFFLLASVVFWLTDIHYDKICQYKTYSIWNAENFNVIYLSIFLSRRSTYVKLSNLIITRLWTVYVITS